MKKLSTLLLAFVFIFSSFGSLAVSAKQVSCDNPNTDKLTTAVTQSTKCKALRKLYPWCFRFNSNNRTQFDSDKCKYTRSISYPDGQVSDCSELHHNGGYVNNSLECDAKRRGQPIVTASKPKSFIAAKKALTVKKTAPKKPVKAVAKPRATLKQK
jgi:hypothetical protein